MNKVVPSIIALSAVLFTAGCGSSGVKSNSYSGMAAHNAGYSNQASHAVYQGNANQHPQYQNAVCQNCGQGSKAVAHNHGHSRATNGATVTHRHSGAVGHAHSGMSGSHSYVTTTAGRNAAGYAVNNGYAANTATRGIGASTLVKAAGALLVGGIIYNATKNDDDNSSGTVTTTTPTMVDDKK